MEKSDNKKSIFDRIKSLWNSLPGAVRFIGTLLSIAIAVKALVPAAAMDINHFGASPELIEPADSSILSWEVSGTSNVSIEPGIGAVGSKGSLSVSPAQTTTYKLIISEKGEEKTASCTVTVKKNSPLVTSFDASPNAIKSGESAVLNWHVSGASNVSIEPDIGAVEPSGTLSVSPVRTTTYKLTASNDDKKDMDYCTVTVEGNLTSSQDNPVTPENDISSQKTDQTNQTGQGDIPTINFFNANPDMIGKGESSNLSWNVMSATKISIEPGIGNVGLSGSQRVFPGQNATYTLTATNEFGSVHAMKVIYVQESSSASTSSTSTSSTSTSSTSTPSSPSSSTSTTSSPSSPTSASSTQVPTKTLSTPKQLSPVNGTVFDNSSLGTTLEWAAVSGAANYTVEIDAFDSSSVSWLSESAGSNIVPGINTTSYSFEFTNEGPGRWRLWAVGPDGKESKKSDWWNYKSS